MVTSTSDAGRAASDAGPGTPPPRGSRDSPGCSPEAAAWRAYGGPLLLFGILTFVEGYVPTKWYPFVYFVKVCAVTAALAVAGTVREIIPSRDVLGRAFLVGLFVFVTWIAIDKWVPYPHLGQRVAFDPFTALTPPRWYAAVFLIVRFYGLALVVPVMEELFMRSFLLRYFTDLDFARVPIGAFSTRAFWIVAGLSATSHPEWLVAAVASCAYALLLKRSGSLFAAVAAHALTNAALGTYVVLTGHWQFW